MRIVVLILLFAFTNNYAQSSFETIGTINGITLERDLNVYSLIYKDTLTGKHTSFNFTDDDDKLQVLYKYLLRTLTEQPQDGFMLQFDNDTLLLIYNIETVTILTYLNHSTENIKKTRPMTASDVIKLFGKNDVVRI